MKVVHLRGLAGSALLALVTFAASNTLCAQQTTDTAATAQAAPARQLTMHSREWLEYRIFISQPASPPPAGGYPVIYVVDGNAWFGLVTEIARVTQQGGPALVVGIGYPATRMLNMQRRSLDLTPPAPDSTVRYGLPNIHFGGADAFLRFIEDSVKPVVQRDYKINTARQALFGHSLGGLFTLHALFTRPDAFQTYIAMSPSIWFNHGYVQGEEQKISSSALQGKHVLLTVGELEQHLTPEQIAWRRKVLEAQPHFRYGKSVDDALKASLEVTANERMVDNAKEMVARLQRRGVQAEFMEYPGLDHGSSVPPAISRGVSFFLTQSAAPESK